MQMQTVGDTDIVCEVFAIGETSGLIAALGLLGMWIGISVEMDIWRLKTNLFDRKCRESVCYFCNSLKLLKIYLLN